MSSTATDDGSGVDDSTSTPAYTGAIRALAEDDSYFTTPPRASSKAAAMSSPTPPSPPAARFRSTVPRGITTRRASSLMVPFLPGAEPGVDPRRASAHNHYAHIAQPCVVDLVDYSATRASFRRLTNRELVGLLQDPRPREPWTRVRWINVAGVSWDVVSALALRYDIHPLAVEDILHQHGTVRSKADYYPSHLFLRVLCHKLSSEHDALDALSAADELLPPLDSIGPIEEEASEHEDQTDGRQTALGTAAVQAERKKKNAQERLLVHELKKKDRVNVRVQPMCIMLFRDGTVISISQDSNVDFLEPIAERLRLPDTGLRQTADPSLLVQSLLDLIVDQALEIADEYQGRLFEIEHTVLIRPSMKTVRSLHVLQGDLIGLHRTLEPVKTMVYGLRVYDADRAAAAAPATPLGYMSRQAKIYLAEVHDHMEHTLMSLDMFSEVSENLINYTFNMVSYQMNDAMRKLTLITIIVLPLTFLSGYFGMNFQGMWTTHDPTVSDFLYWEIALPVLAFVVPLFVMPDLRRMVHQIRKGLALRRMRGKGLLRR